MIIAIWVLGAAITFFYGVYRYGQNRDSDEAVICLLGFAFWPLLIPVSIVYKLGQKNAK